MFRKNNKNFLTSKGNKGSGRKLNKTKTITGRDKV